MSENDRSEVEQSLDAILHRRFPGADPEIVKTYAKDFCLIAHGGQGYNELCSIEKSAEKDREQLAKIVRHLNRASNSLAEIGWNGRTVLYDYANEIANPDNPVRASVGIMGVDSAIAGMIDEIAGRIKEAATRIGPETRSVFEILGRAEKRGQPINFAAHLVARRCKRVFEDLGDNPATRRSDWRTGKSHGPFLEFVEEVFKALGIEANAEAAIRTNPLLDKIL